jgi:hypothetical protein
VRNRYRLSDRNLIKKLIAESEQALIRERNAAVRALANGLLGRADGHRETKAQQACIAARAAVRERFPSALERRAAAAMAQSALTVGNQYESEPAKRGRQPAAAEAAALRRPSLH